MQAFQWQVVMPIRRTLLPRQAAFSAVIILSFWYAIIRVILDIRWQIWIHVAQEILYQCAFVHDMDLLAVQAPPAYSYAGKDVCCRVWSFNHWQGASSGNRRETTSETIWRPGGSFLKPMIYLFLSFVFAFWRCIVDVLNLSLYLYFFVLMIQNTFPTSLSNWLDEYIFIQHQEIQ